MTAVVARHNYKFTSFRLPKIDNSGTDDAEENVLTFTISILA